MGYDVHITRADEWAKSKINPISLEEWTAYLQSDVDMRLDGFAEATTTQGERVRYENPGLAVWTKYSKDDSNTHQAWFDFRNGKIVVKNPDDEILKKMKEIAKAFNAKIIGDDGEFY